MGKKQTRILNVFLNGALVGELKKGPSGLISFKYTDEWIKGNFAISQSLPIQEQEFKGEIVSRYFDNLLPDNDEIKKNIAKKFGAESIRSFDLLAVAGKDCVGALSFFAKGEGYPATFEMKYQKLTAAKVARKIRGLGSVTPLGMEGDGLKLSIAGAQEKMALLKIGNSWYEPYGSTPTTHIIKTPIGILGEALSFDDSVDNEWASLFLMKKFNLPTCHAQIETFEDQRVLVVERFDRRWVKNKTKADVILRLPQEDMCQALGVSPYKKYQNEGGPGLQSISNILAASSNSNDKLIFFKGIMVFDLLYAIDGHGKNFSIKVNPDGFRLTPFYDVMSGYFLHAREKRPLQRLKLAMSVGNSNYYNFHKISKRHYEESAKKCSINSRDFEQIVSELKTSLENLDYTKKELDPNLSEATLDMIIEGMHKRAKRIL